MLKFRPAAFLPYLPAEKLLVLAESAAAVANYCSAVIDREGYGPELVPGLRTVGKFGNHYGFAADPSDVYSSAPAIAGFGTPGRREILPVIAARAAYSKVVAGGYASRSEHGRVAELANVTAALVAALLSSDQGTREAANLVANLLDHADAVLWLLATGGKINPEDEGFDAIDSEVAAYTEALFGKLVK